MSTVDYKTSHVTKFVVDQPAIKGETVVEVWNLDELKEKKIPFERLDEDKLECIVELGGDDDALDSKIRIRFGLVKTQYPQCNGAAKLNYLSLYATALSTGGRENLEILVSLDYLKADLGVKSSPLKESVVNLKYRRGRGRKQVFNQLLFYSQYHDSYHREISETIHSECMIFGITVTLVNQANEQPLQKISPHDDFSFRRSWQAMYESEKSYSDIKLETKDGMVLDAHKFVLAARSPVLRDMLNKSGGDEEGAEGNLKIDNINGKPMRSILYWMYTNSLDESADKIIGEVMEGAKLLQLKGFLTLIDTKLITVCHPKNMMQLFTAALEHKMKTAVEDIRDYIKEHIEDPSLKL